MKPTPQRTYTRNGTIFKTVDGVRMRFGLRMNCRFKFSNQIEQQQFIRELIRFRYEQQLKLFNQSGFYYTKELETIGFDGDDFIHDIQTVRIRFARVPEGVNILNM